MNESELLHPHCCESVIEIGLRRNSASGRDEGQNKKKMLTPIEVN